MGRSDKPRKPKQPQKPPPPDPYATIPEKYRPAKWLIEAPHRPPNDELAIDHLDVLYACVGRIMTAWELLESSLANQFQSIVEGQKESSFAAYGSVLGSGARCDMLVAATAARYPDEDKSVYLRFIADVRRLGAVRNQVAHGLVVAARPDGKWVSTDARILEPGRFLLIPAPYNTNKYNKGAKKTGPEYIYSQIACSMILDEIHKMLSRSAAFMAMGEHQDFVNILFE